MKRNKRRMHAGFSLLELMLVLAIIGVLMAVAAVNLMGRSEAAKIRATKASMAQIRNALRSYQVEHNSYPPTLEALTVGKTAYLSSDTRLLDGWSQQFVYGIPGSGGHDFDLISKGGDGIFATADDIDIWKLDQPAPQ